MHHSNVLDTAILHHYIDNIVILHYYNELVSFLCLIDISSNFKEHPFKENLSVAATKYRIWDTENNTKEVKL